MESLYFVSFDDAERDAIFSLNFNFKLNRLNCKLECWDLFRLQLWQGQWIRYQISDISKYQEGILHRMQYRLLISHHSPPAYFQMIKLKNIFFKTLLSQLQSGSGPSSGDIDQGEPRFIYDFLTPYGLLEQLQSKITINSWQITSIVIVGQN